MKTCLITHKPVLLVAAIASAGLYAGSANAELIASDSFALGAAGQADNSYDVGSLRDASNPIATLNTTGYLGNWESNTGAIYATTGGLTHALTTGSTSEGRLIAFNGTGSAGGAQERTLNYTPTDGTYYFSALFQKSAVTTTQDLIAGVTQDIAASNGSSTLGSGLQMGIVDGGFSVNNGTGFIELITAASFNVNETYFGLIEINFSTTGTDSATFKVYNAASSLVSKQAYTGLNLDGKLDHLSVSTNNYGPDVSADEFRYGTELSDVQVPEPSSLALLGLGGLLAVRRRR